LPENTRYKCSSSVPPKDPPKDLKEAIRAALDSKCGKKATWYHHSTCNCGECDMSMALCDEHKAEYSKLPTFEEAFGGKSKIKGIRLGGKKR